MARLVEDQRFVMGQGHYVEDLAPGGTCHMAVVRSTHAHARITGIATAEAMAAPGVRAVLTADDLRVDGIGGIGCHFYPEDLYPAEPTQRISRGLLADGLVRHVGDRLAVVVADSAAAAKDAAERVEVTYDPLTPVATPEAAMAEAAPRLWDEVPGNVLFRYSLGDKAATGAALKEARHVVSLELRNQRVLAFPLEQRGAVGEFRADTGYVLHTSAQSPHRSRSQLAQALNETENGVRVIVGDVGGAFGLKVALFPEEALVLWASKRVGRPVRWSPDRSESFLSDDHARDQSARLQLGVSEEGRIVAYRADLVSNLGAYLASTGTVPAIFGPQMSTGIYDIPEACVTVTGVLTNTQPIAPYRGAGRPEAIYAIERIMDLAAARLGIDPADFRRRNLVPERAMPYRSVLGPLYDCGDFGLPLDRALQRSGWDDFAARREASEKRGQLRGIGIGTYVEVAAFFNDRVDIQVEPDGSVTVVSGTVSSGQRHREVFASLVEQWLGVPAGKVRLVTGDTAIVPFGRGTFGSRSMTVLGSALKRAADAVIEKAKVRAAASLDVDLSEVRFEDGRFLAAGTNRSLSLSDVAALTYVGAPEDPEAELGLRASGTFSSPPANYPNGCKRVRGRSRSRDGAGQDRPLHGRRRLRAGTRSRRA